MPTVSIIASGPYLPKTGLRKIYPATTNVNIFSSVTEIPEIHSAESSSTEQGTYSSTCKRCFGLQLCCSLLLLLLLLLTGGGLAAGILTSNMGASSTSINSSSTAVSSATSATSVGTTTTGVTTTTVNVPSSVLNNTCTAIISGTVTTLLYLSNVAAFSYTYYQYSYVAISTSTIMMLALRQDPSYWCLDDISVTENGVQLWQDGGFEQSPLTQYYTYCNPNGASSSGTISAACPHSGSYNFYDGSVTYSDYLSQSFSTVVGSTYNISFWLANQGGGPDSFLVLIGG
ncbi:unnamed protein product [Rotaria magnacalcarata]|uniref:Uncharacterized protein n=2 Tax=Rotaria magnacalcarata TaxID=392030 RepID=A0A819QD55_9BILA|nr:unnamed protein product [Rotaria magnacalcarata]CAF4184980.1 unnamed protein product [Rotaria magnacalcarata]